MNALPTLSAATEASSPAAIYVVLAGVVCTGLGWWLRSRVMAGEAGTGPAAETAPASSDPDDGMVEKLAAAEESTAAARRECETAVEKAAALSRELTAATAARTAAEEARTAAETRAEALAADLVRTREAIGDASGAAAANAIAAQQEELDRLRQQISSVESDLAQGRRENERLAHLLEEKSAALVASVPASAVTTLENALAEAKLEIESQAAALSEKSAAFESSISASEAAALRLRVEELTAETSRLREEVEAARTPSTAHPLAAAPAPDESVEALRSELTAARAEIRQMKAALSAPKPRPILTSPRPDGGGPRRA